MKNITDYARCIVTHPDGIINRGRFIFFDGIAAVWVENKALNVADRVLFATGAKFTKAANGREPHRVSLGTGEQWEIVQQNGGCGCGKSALKYKGYQDLLNPDLTHLP